MKLQALISTAVAVPIFSFTLVVAAHADTIVSLPTVQDTSLGTLPGDANSTDDTEVYLSNGSHTYSAVLQWDLSGIVVPAGQAITDAYITMYSEGNYATKPFRAAPSLINTPAGQSGIDETTLTWNIFNGNDTSGNPNGSYNYQAAGVSTALGGFNVTPGTTPGITVTSDHASAGDLALLNARQAMPNAADQYVLMELAFSASPPTYAGLFQDHLFNVGDHGGFAPTLNLTISPVPEPGAIVLSAFALAALCIAGRVQRSRRDAI